jgi:hypothetical protein
MINRLPEAALPATRRSSPARTSGRIERFGQEMRASRILVNAPGAHCSFGIETGRELSMTLGRGTFRGNSTNDSITYRHL